MDNIQTFKDSPLGLMKMLKAKLKKVLLIMKSSRIQMSSMGNHISSYFILQLENSNLTFFIDDSF
jgi:hypothetical protein